MAATIQATFGLDIDPLRRGFNQAAGLARSAGSAIARAATATLAGGVIAAGAAAVTGAALGFHALARGVMGVVQTGAELEKLHRQTGLAVGSLSTLKDVFAEADVSSDNLAGSIGKMQRNLFNAEKAGGPAASSFRFLHLDIDQLFKLRPEEQFQKIGSAIAALPSPVARTAAAMSIFGKTGAELIPVFDAMGHSDFGNLSAKAAILNKDAESFHRITLAMHRARAQLQGVFVGLADKVAPAILSAANVLVIATRGALNWGLAIGKALVVGGAFLAGMFLNSEKYGETIGNALKWGFASAANFLSDALRTVALETGATLLEALGKGLGHIPGMGDKGKALGLDAAVLRATAEGLGKATLDTFGAQGFQAAMKKAGAEVIASGAMFAKVLAAALEGAAGNAKKGESVDAHLARLAQFTGKGAAFAAFSTALGSFATFGGPMFDANPDIALRGATNARFLSRTFGSPSDRPFDYSQVANLRTAFGASPLLSVNERRSFENAAVAGGQERQASVPGALHAIRSGDRARQREEDKKHLRQMDGVDKTNDILQNVIAKILKDGLTGED